MMIKMSKPMETWLYQRRLLDLERGFKVAREKIADLEHELKSDPEKANKTAFKMRLDLVIGMARLLKEQAAFYLRLREFYDLASMRKDLVDEFRREDPELCAKIIERIDKRWGWSDPEPDNASKLRPGNPGGELATDDGTP